MQVYDITIVLLAGGEATRLPGKLALSVEGEPLLVRTYRRLTNTGRPCIVSVRNALSAELAESIDAEYVFDAYEKSGPLGGLASAAAHVKSGLFFAAAADLAYMDSQFVDMLADRFRWLAESGARGGSASAPDALLPRWKDGKVEPLAALYATAPFLDGAVRALGQGRKKVTAALAGRNIAYYDIQPADEDKFWNVNTPADFAELTKK